MTTAIDPADARAALEAAMAELAPEDDNQWLPRYCPSWCSRDHAAYLAEGADWDDAKEHSSASSPEIHLPEICNMVDGRVMRAGGSEAWLQIRQMPYRPSGGNLTLETIDLTAREDWVNRGPVARLRLTSGEARVLARQLVSLADLVDL